jgi:HTH-type transcriptional regulator/antitoxin HigA
MKHDATLELTGLIRDDEEYDRVVEEIDHLLDANPMEGSTAERRLEYLSVLVEDYDRKHFELPGSHATPQQIVEFMLETHELDKSALVEAMGGRSRVSEFLSGKRPLSLSQVYALRDLLHIPADLLIGESPAASRVRERSANSYAPAKRPTVHVAPTGSGGKFVVTIAGKPFTQPASKPAAIRRAILLARQNRVSTITIQGLSGRITTMHVGENDPRPPRNRRR